MSSALIGWYDLSLTMSKALISSKYVRLYIFDLAKMNSKLNSRGFTTTMRIILSGCAGAQHPSRRVYLRINCVRFRLNFSILKKSYRPTIVVHTWWWLHLSYPDSCRFSDEESNEIIQLVQNLKRVLERQLQPLMHQYESVINVWYIKI